MIKLFMIRAIKRAEKSKRPKMESFLEMSQKLFWLFSSSPPPFKIPSFMYVSRVITAKCVMLRCKVCRINLFTVVDLFTTPNFIAL